MRFASARFGVGLIMLAAFGMAGAHDDDHPPKPVPEKEAHRPTALPDRIILTWKSDPAHSQAVTWRTDLSVKRALAQIAPAEHGPLNQVQAREALACSSRLDSDLGAALYHAVEFSQLKHSTKYVYRVGDGVNWSAWFHFTTASDRPDPFTFVYFGDAQNDIKSQWSRVFREAFSDAPKARFMLHAGDLINSANRDADWGEWHAAAGWVNGMIPTFPAPGNHEYARIAKDSPIRKLSGHWRAQFSLPENGPKGFEETAYFIDIQGTRMIALNSNEDWAIQGAWLESVLANNPCRWTIITFHHPIYSSGQNRDNEKLRAAWQPIFDKYRVDLVLQGHDHTYARSGLATASSTNVPTGVTAQSPSAGTIYVVSVSGPKMYNFQRHPTTRRGASMTQLYQIIHVNSDFLLYEARTAVGALYDAFELRKRPGQVNELIERPAALAERILPLPKPAKKPAAASPKPTANGQKP